MLPQLVCNVYVLKIVCYSQQNPFVTKFVYCNRRYCNRDYRKDTINSETPLSSISSCSVTGDRISYWNPYSSKNLCYFPKTLVKIFSIVAANVVIPLSCYIYVDPS